MDGLNVLASVCYKQFIYEKLTTEDIVKRLLKFKFRVLDIREKPKWISRCHKKYSAGVLILHYGDIPFYVMIDPYSDKVDRQRLRRIRYNCRRHTRVSRLYHLRYKCSGKTKHIVRCLFNILKDSRRCIKSKTYIVR